MIKLYSIAGVKFNFLNLIVAALLCTNVNAQDKPEITTTTSPKGWIIRTQSSAYQIMVTANGKVKNVFYGPAEQAEFLQRNASWTESMDEVPARGSYPFKTPALEVIFNDNVRDADLREVSGEIITVDKRPTLKIVQRDSIYPLEVTSYIRVLKEYDILEKWIVVTNTAKKGNIRIENLQSGSISLPADQYILTHLAGGPENEFQTRGHSKHNQ